MTANLPWWLRWSAAKHVPTWGADELAQMLAAQQHDRRVRQFGPNPPPAEAVEAAEPAPKKAEWPFRDRKNDSGLSSGHVFPPADRVPRILDRLHHR